MVASSSRPAASAIWFPPCSANLSNALTFEGHGDGFVVGLVRDALEGDADLRRHSGLGGAAESGAAVVVEGRAEREARAAVDGGAEKVALPQFVKRELEGYPDCGLLYRGFVRLGAKAAPQTRSSRFRARVAAFCPSCVGRKMCATAANGA